MAGDEGEGGMEGWDIGDRHVGGVVVGLVGWLVMRTLNKLTN